PLDLDVIDRLRDLRSQLSLAGPDIDLPAMPWAGDGRPIDRPLRQRASLMRANPIDCRDHPADIIERVNPALELDFPGGARSKFAQGRELDKSRHVLLFGLVGSGPV